MSREVTMDEYLDEVFDEILDELDELPVRIMCTWYCGVPVFSAIYLN